ncbi:hypothetical protein HaLaN_13259 [Haematococcus lacustris]|uniref:Uncharacterized protein n=1 Tax=Haematococcus lacustris TaxID=44745 RepID=A0A699ZCN1_HAELA|nr:hypothetical protein HaLaN_13259 [Haematococcus lacustris]
MLHTSPLTTAATFASGVFEADQNEVRSRSMMRVSLRKELSTASMRLPQPQKQGGTFPSAFKPDLTAP